MCQQSIWRSFDDRPIKIQKVQAPKQGRIQGGWKRGNCLWGPKQSYKIQYIITENSVIVYLFLQNFDKPTHFTNTF